MTGTWVQLVAQDLLVLELSKYSSSALGVAVALQTAPIVLFSLWGGALADRHDTRRLLIRTQIGIALPALTLGLLTVTSVATFGLVWALALMTGAMSGLNAPVQQAFVAETVSEDEALLAKAIGLSAMVSNAGQIIGSALAAAMYPLVGANPLFLLNAISFGGVILALRRMDRVELMRVAPRPRS